MARPRDALGAARPTPERWAVDAGTRDVAALVIPPDARRDRDFEIDCRFVVKARAGARSPWHALRVTVDGALEWSRRIPTGNPGHSDSLDLRFRRNVPLGRGLRIAATTEVGEALRVALTIHAQED